MPNLVLPSDELKDFIDRVQASKKKTGPTQDEKIRDTISAVLAQLGALTVGEDSLLFEGEKFILPANYEGRVEKAIRFLQDHIEQQTQHFDFGRTYRYRPHDGAHAFMAVLRDVSGTTGFGVTKMTFFGPVLPQFETVNVGFNQTTQVPWGTVAFPPYEAEFELGYDRDPEVGILFRLNVEAPRKWRKHIEALFSLIEEKLRTDSIYRGKAITGAEWPDFLNPNMIDSGRIVYSQEVLTQLGANVWTLLEHTDQMRAMRIPLKRAVLVEGPYGTGKTLAGLLTAQKAVANGWTFIQCRPGKDDPGVVLATAQLYAPAVVWIEDIEVVASGDGSTKADISRLLEMLDGVTSKGVEVVAGFTTNHIGEIHKGALRPGRIDAVIRIGGLDEAGFRKLVNTHVPAEYLGDHIDFQAVAAAFDGFLPAFAVEAINRAMRYAIYRNDGVPTEINTDDLVHAAEGLRPQLDLMAGAKEGQPRAGLDDHMRQLVEGTLRRTRVGSARVTVQEATALNGAR